MAAADVAASLGLGASRTYQHRDLGLVADLGGWYAVAERLGVPLTGPVAKAVARGSRRASRMLACQEPEAAGRR